MENRRKELRYRVQAEGVINARGRRLRIQTENLSLSGARVTSDRPLLEGDEITLDLALKDSGEVKNFKIPGTVVWCAEDMDAGFQAGLSLVPTPEDARIMKQCIVRYAAV
jgi:hypothetical protein